MSQEKRPSQIESTSEKDPKTSSKTLGFETKLPKLSQKENQLHLWLCPGLPPLKLWMGTHPVEMAGECACHDNSHPWSFHLAQTTVEVAAHGLGDWGEPHHTLLPSWHPKWHGSAQVIACTTPSSVPPHIPRMGHIPEMASDPTVTDTDHR